MIAAIAFYLFAGVMIGAALLVISARNPVHSVLFLILAFFNAAALFVLLGAEFLAMILVVVYVGAVAVLFLFVVMMLDIDFAELRQGFAALSALWRAAWPSDPGVELVIVLGALGDRRGRHTACPSGAGPSANTAGSRTHSLYGLHLLFPDRGSHPAGRDDRRHRADIAPPPRRQPQSIAAQNARRRKGGDLIDVKPGEGAGT